MSGKVTHRPKVPTFVYVVGALGAGLGGIIGNAMCVGYDILYGPWFPQAGVNPQPAGWAGWWILKGGAVGACVGLVLAGAIVGMGRLIGRLRSTAQTTDHEVDDA